MAPARLDCRQLELRQAVRRVSNRSFDTRSKASIELVASAIKPGPPEASQLRRSEPPRHDVGRGPASPRPVPSLPLGHRGLAGPLERIAPPRVGVRVLLLLPCTARHARPRGRVFLPLVPRHGLQLARLPRPLWGARGAARPPRRAAEGVQRVALLDGLDDLGGEMLAVRRH
eukprot:scaffold16536_cov45-Phaeocystis_antarctica.AAC.1